MSQIYEMMKYWKRKELERKLKEQEEQPSANNKVMKNDR
jgi:hypothetical protein